jgi:hypothetical protein
MVYKNRQAKGEQIRKTHLTKEQAKTILESKTSVKELAKNLNVPYGVVWNVRNGKSYKWAKG